MRVIGLTGSLASGKSTVAGYLRKKGARVISADKIAHDLIKPGGGCYKKVVQVFGEEILKGKTIDRSKLAAVVFKNRMKLKKLEAIIHPKVRTVIKKELNKHKKTNKTIVLEVPLLIESGLHKLADAVVVVVATQARQLKRATAKGGMSRAQALRRIKAQMPLRRKVRYADFIIDNNGTKKQTEKQVNVLWEKL